MVQQRTVQLNGVEVAYLLTRKKVKRINLCIKPGGEMSVSANTRVSIRAIEQFMIANADYILTQRERQIQIGKPKPKPYKTGETFYLLGKPLQLQVTESPIQKVEIIGNQLCLQTKFPENTEHNEKLVQQFYNQLARELLTKKVEECYPLFEPMGVEFPTLKFRRMKSRWGSCMPTKNQINLNTKLLSYPMGFIEYVVLHEFCHFIHPDHSKKFYSLVESLMPDWKVRKQYETANLE